MRSSRSSASTYAGRIAGVAVACVLLLTMCSCFSCCLWMKQGDFAREAEQRVGSASRVIALRDRLDRAHDRFATAPLELPCTSVPPAEEVIVLAHSGLAAFRQGEGSSTIDDSDFGITSTFLQGRDRPPNDVSDDDAAARLDTLFSPLRSLMDARWVAVMQTIEARRPAVFVGSFLGGHYHGRIVVFDLTTGEPVCATDVRATNAGAIDVGAIEGGSDAALADLVARLALARDDARLRMSPQLRLRF